MRSNTETGTTTTAEAAAVYRGRFAPSPSGPLHMGSLLTALGSWLDARSRHGQWLVRIEDLDTPRSQPGIAQGLLATLARCGLESDDTVLWQSQRHAAYEAALQQLQRAGLLYPCSCTRRNLAQAPYDGRCRQGPQGPGPHSLRLRLPDSGGFSFEDALQGTQRGEWAALGDPVLVRRDGLVAYQLAVVVDDAFQGISDVVRGADLLSATGWQLALIDALGLPQPRYAHLPLLLGIDGQKLSKSHSAAALDALEPVPAVLQALRLLQQQPPAQLADASIQQVLEWAIDQWNPLALSGVADVNEPLTPAD